MQLSNEVDIMSQDVPYSLLSNEIYSYIGTSKMYSSESLASARERTEVVTGTSRMAYYSSRILRVVVMRQWYARITWWPGDREVHSDQPPHPGITFHGSKETYHSCILFLYWWRVHGHLSCWNVQYSAVQTSL
jgi:hypothetical protein